MKLLKNWFIVKRPKTSVKQKAQDFIKQYTPNNGLNDDRSLTMRRVGFEDGYLACLEDLGINHTIDGKAK